MNQGELILANFDARISKIKIKPKNKNTRVTIFSKMYDEVTEEKNSVKIKFLNVAAISFEINYFDNMIGSEAFGLYRITEKSFIEKLINRTFYRRKELYLLEGDYEYDENDPYDLLNTLDQVGSFQNNLSHYTAYVQNVDAGTYVIVAENIQIIR